jgi:hypothetical protein
MLGKRWDDVFCGSRWVNRHGIFYTMNYFSLKGEADLPILRLAWYDAFLFVLLKA